MNAGDEKAWTGTLVAGALVATVVGGLLETLRREAARVAAGVDRVWAAGQLVAANTQTTHLLTASGRLAGELAGALDGQPAAEPRDTAAARAPAGGRSAGPPQSEGGPT